MKKILSIIVLIFTLSGCNSKCKTEIVDLKNDLKSLDKKYSMLEEKFLHEHRMRFLDLLIPFPELEKKARLNSGSFIISQRDQYHQYVIFLLINLGESYEVYNLSLLDKNAVEVPVFKMPSKELNTVARLASDTLNTVTIDGDAMIPYACYFFSTHNTIVEYSVEKKVLQVTFYKIFNTLLSSPKASFSIK